MSRVIQLVDIDSGTGQVEGVIHHLCLSESTGENHPLDQ
jgi:hypothetical protein